MPKLSFNDILAIIFFLAAAGYAVAVALVIARSLT